jgi:DeoR/GlpR family transcriptional regulator of sugar metabolism
LFTLHLVLCGCLLPPGNMLTAERHKRILSYLQVHRSARLTVLASELGVGPSTVRRDLKEMEDRGLLERVYGGAVLADKRSEEQPAMQRVVHNAEAKHAIGAAAANLVRDGSTIIITGGTTTEAMVHCLRDKQGLTVITNALNIAALLAQHPHISTIVLGGWLRCSELSLLGHLTVQAMQELRADQIYHGTFSLDPDHGLAGSFMQEVETDRIMIAAARELIVLADHSKFERSGPVRLAPVERIATVVTDALASPAALAVLQAKGIQVIVGRD